MKFPNTKKFRGFSLVEVLLATVVLGVGLVGVAKFQGGLYKSSTIAKQKVEALKVAEKQLEELRHFSTATEFETNFTNELSGIKTVRSGTEAGDIETYTYNAYVEPGSNGRSANLSVEVTWPDLTNEGTVSDDTTLHLSTIVSNSTPASFVLSQIGPTPESPDTEEIDIEITPPSNTVPNDSNPDKCTCKTVTTRINPDLFGREGFVKVSGLHGEMHDNEEDDDDEEYTSTTTTTTTSTFTNEECDLCCAAAGGAWATVETESSYEETSYNNFQDQLENFLYSEAEAYFKTRMDDQVVGASGFDPRYLIKGYQSRNNFFEKLLKTSSEHRSESGSEHSSESGSEHSSKHSTTTTTVYSALCGIATETVTKTTYTTSTPEKSSSSSKRVCKLYGKWSSSH